MEIVYIVSEPERDKCENDIMSSLCQFQNGPRNGSKKWGFGLQNWGIKIDAETPPTNFDIQALGCPVVFSATSLFFDVERPLST